MMVAFKRNCEQVASNETAVNLYVRYGDLQLLVSIGNRNLVAYRYFGYKCSIKNYISVSLTKAYELSQNRNSTWARSFTNYGLCIDSHSN